MPYKDKNSIAAKESKRKALLKWLAKAKEHWNNYQAEYKRKNRKHYSELTKNPFVHERMKQQTRKWQQAHKDYISQKHKNHSNELTDQYIVRQLFKDGLPRYIARNNPMLIEAKRTTLLIKRKIKHGN